MRLSSQQTIERDIAVFQYVNGLQSDDEKTSFEHKLGHDKQLQQEVIDEQSLSYALKSIDHNTYHDRLSIDELLHRIDAIQDKTVSTLQGHDASKKRSFWRYGAAAIIIFSFTIGVITNDLLKPKFTTLSSPNSANEYDFSQLATQHRLIKIIPRDNIESRQLFNLIESYNLETITTAGKQSSILLKSPSRIDIEMLSRMQSDSRIKHFELVLLNETKN